MDESSTLTREDSRDQIRDPLSSGVSGGIEHFHARSPRRRARTPRHQKNVAHDVAYRPLRGVLRRGRVRARVVQLPARARRRRVLVEGYDEIARVVVVVVARGARRRRRRPRRVLLARAARARFSDRPRRRGRTRKNRTAAPATPPSAPKPASTKPGQGKPPIAPSYLALGDATASILIVLIARGGRGPGRALPGDDHRDPAVRPRLGRRRVSSRGITTRTRRTPRCGGTSRGPCPRAR